MLIVGGTRDAGNSRSVWAINETTKELIWSYDTGGDVYDIAIYNNADVFIVGVAADNGDGNGTRNIWKLDHAGNYKAGAQIASDTTAWSIDVDDNWVYVGTNGGCSRNTHALDSNTEWVAASANWKSMAVDSSGNIFPGRGGGGNDYFKYDSSFNLGWFKDLGAADCNDGLTEAGFNYVGGDASTGGALTKYNTAGTQQWRQATYAIEAMKWNNAGTKIYVVGSSAGAAGHDFGIIEPSDGSQDSGFNDGKTLYGIALDSNDVAYVGGAVASSFSVWSVSGSSFVNLYNTTTQVNVVEWTSATGTLYRTDLKYKRELIAIGNDEIWYETPSGTMTELTAANGQIDTGDKLSADIAFQKLFVANGTNLIVCDFVNTKIATTDAGANPTTKGMILTGGTSAATMIVDFATAVTDDAAATIYGYRTSSATFASGETVTGTNGDGNAVSFVTSAAEVAPPHYYTWTPYGNDTTTYGSMPTKAYIVARYRGRLVLAGDPNYPHQWYMSKVADPWGWLYSSNDPLSAISGQDADAGELGDIITALIPYGDDYLLIGCAGSIHMVTGDPAAGGRVDEISNNVGIFSQNAWCKDSQGNLYFFGTRGLYKMEGGRSKPVNLSIGVLPTWIEDWAINPDQEMITVVYDAARDGIIIAKLDTVDGTNQAYWFSLKTMGFYPEIYPEEAVPWCGISYDSLSSTYRHLAIGSADGYIRYFLDTAKSDDIGASDEAISSYVTLPTMMLGDGLDKEGKIDQIIIESSGGASSGDYSDTDSITYDVYGADDAETLIEDVRDGATSALTGSVSGTGRKARIRQRVRGMYGTIKLSNATISSGWAVNRIMYNNQLGGSL